MWFHLECHFFHPVLFWLPMPLVRTLCWGLDEFLPLSPNNCSPPPPPTLPFLGPQPAPTPVDFLLKLLGWPSHTVLLIVILLDCNYYKNEKVCQCIYIVVYGTLSVSSARGGALLPFAQLEICTIPWLPWSSKGWVLYGLEKEWLIWRKKNKTKKCSYG